MRHARSANIFEESPRLCVKGAMIARPRMSSLLLPEEDDDDWEVSSGSSAARGLRFRPFLSRVFLSSWAMLPHGVCPDASSTRGVVRGGLGRGGGRSPETSGSRSVRLWGL
jgi:hypothetical protein